jgi:putative ABC transport system permease protein
VTLIRRALRSRPVRFWLTAGGIGVTALLVMVLGAAYHSVSSNVAAYTGQPGMDIWVAPGGVDNLMRSSAFLTAHLPETLATMHGVASADAIVRSYVTVRDEANPSSAGRRLALIAIGYTAPSGSGGPPIIAQGRAPRDSTDITLDRASASRLRVILGDTVWVNGHAGVVVGLTNGTNLLSTQFLFANLAAVSEASALRGRASFAVVRRAAGVRPGELLDSIRARFPRLSVFGREEFIANNVREVAAGFIPLLTLVALLGLLAATVLVTLLVHAVVEERREDLAVLLALGADARALIGTLVREALVLALLGAILGIAAAAALGAVLDRALPVIPLAFQSGDAARVLLVFGAAASCAAILPLARLRRIDPLEAFRP